MSIVTSLRSGRTCFPSPNWTTNFLMPIKSILALGPLPQFQGVPVFISKGENVLVAEVNNKTTSYAVIENEWSCTSTLYYESTVHYLMKLWDNFGFTSSAELFWKPVRNLTTVTSFYGQWLLNFPASLNSHIFPVLFRMDNRGNSNYFIIQE